MSIKIAYLHGLESNNKGKKNDWLRTVASVYDPLIDYKEENIYTKLKTEIEEFQPELIIGSSMGGYFAYHIAKELNIPALLFNPALHSRTFEPDMAGLIHSENDPSIQIIVGENDSVIEPRKTIEIIENKPNIKLTTYGHEHRTPYDVFKKETEKLLN